MQSFRLSRTALREVAKIVSDLHRSVGAEVADSAERQLFAAFHDLGRLPAIGHARSDLTAKRLLFHASKPYMIAFRREGGRAMIVHVIHGSRDLSKLI